jgi:hypothetical protein
MSAETNVSGDKCQQRQMSAETNVSGDKCQQRQMSAETNVSGDKCQRRQMSAETIVSRYSTCVVTATAQTNTAASKETSVHVHEHA